MTKYSCLEKAIEITKEAARGGNTTIPLHVLLEDLYKKIKELNEDTNR